MEKLVWGLLTISLMVSNMMIAAANDTPEMTGRMLDVPAKIDQTSVLNISPSERLNLDDAISRINELRAANGAKPVSLSKALSMAAHDQSMFNAANDAVSHYGNAGSTPVTRVAGTGYDAVQLGEAVAAGQRHFDDVIHGWSRSETHRKTLLLENASHVGLALVEDPTRPSRTYWTMVIAEPF